jgi:hypothetical protein
MSLLLVLTAALPSAARDPDPDIPGVDFTVTTRLKKDGRTSEAIHQFALHCGLGACSLDILVLNECEPTGSPKAAFAPKLITRATWAGTLEVKRIGDAVVEARAHKAFHGRASIRIRFTYVPKLPAATRVTGFEAVEMDDPDLEQPEPGAVEYLPLEGTSLIPLACPLLATGVKK